MVSVRFLPVIILYDDHIRASILRCEGAVPIIKSQPFKPYLDTCIVYVVEFMLINLVYKWGPGVHGVFRARWVGGVVDTFHVHHYFAIAPIRAGINVVANNENIALPAWSLVNICLFLKRDVLGFENILTSSGDVVNFFLIILNFFLSKL